jgi:di/tricarboxylate transporter
MDNIKIYREAYYFIYIFIINMTFYCIFNNTIVYESLTIIAIIASVFTVVEGIYHLKMVSSNNVNAIILFLVGGLSQLFWVIPTIRNWRRT